MNELQCTFIFRLRKHIGVWANMYVAYVIVKKVHMDKYKENKNDRNCDYCMHVPLWFGTQKISGTMIFLGEECTDYF